MQNSTKTNTKRKESIERESRSEMPLLGNNFLLMAIAVVMIVIGFALMGGSPSGVDAYNPDIFSARRIVVGPTISFLGFVLMAVAIVIRPKGINKKD